VTTFYDTFMAYPVAERQRIADESGLSLGYIQKHTYVSSHEPKFHFDNAVRLDLASSGVLQFWEHTEGAVDWRYVRARLKQAKRQGLFA
jgi:hypothetical protein